MNQSVKDIQARLDYEANRSAPPEGFEQLPDIPAGRYIDPAFFQLEQDTIWQRSWLFAGHTDELQQVGDYKLWDDAGQPVVILRDEQDQIRAYYNTCRHRGAPVVAERQGNAKRLKCAYHGWTYALDGELVGVPEQRDFVDLDRSCRNLVSLRCELWGGWIFVNLDNDAEPLLDYLGNAVPDLAQFDIDKLRFYEKHSIPVAANWKVCLDAFMEVYHLQFIHPETVNELLDYKAAAMGLLKNGHSWMYTRLRHGVQESVEGVPEISSVGELPRMTNMAYSLFPNFVVPLDMTGFPLLIFWPESINRTRLDVWWFGPEDGETARADRVFEDKARLAEAWQQRLEIFDVVLGEDTQWLPAVQRSMETPAFSGVPLSYQERRIYHSHEAVDDCIGRARVPKELQVEPMLAQYLEDPVE
jgi:phenylpropionate dioxygenase-like ring-hydroxylating dioxygenase large terminal subunit